MEEITELTRELSEYIKQKKRVSAEELVSWSKNKGLSSVILYIVVQELLKDKSFQATTDKIIIDEIFHIEVPTSLYYLEATTEKIPTPTKQIALREEKKKQRKTTVKKPAKGPSLLAFLEQQEEPKESENDQDMEKPEEEPLHEPEQLTELPPSRQNEPQIFTFDNRREPEPPQQTRVAEPVMFQDLEITSDLETAIRYLGKYWSVGRLRLIDDLMGMGVKDPIKVINELARKGLIEITELDVVNAKKELIEVAKSYLKEKNIADIFST